MSIASAERGADVVVARRQAENAELSEIVGLRDSAAGRRHAATAVGPRLAHRRDVDVRQRLAKLVDDAAGDHAAARHGDVGVLEHLFVGQLDRPAGLERAGLPVLNADVAGLRGRQVEAPAWKIAELEAAVAVGHRRLRHDLGPHDADLRPADWRARFGRQHAAGDPRRARLELSALPRHLKRLAGPGLNDLDLRGNRDEPHCDRCRHDARDSGEMSHVHPLCRDG